ncbi:MAG: class I SAM-dependent rRNA methyltransferase [Pseudomonadota bacterium]
MLVKLKPGKEKNAVWKHPWIFSGAISKAPDEFCPEVRIESAKGDFLGIGYYNPKSQIALRILSFLDQKLDRDFFYGALSRSFSRRQHILTTTNTACRLVASEADELPGLIIDQYGLVIVLQFLTAGMEFYRNIILDLVIEMLKPETVWDRSDEAVREKEGLEQTSGLLFGKNITSETLIIENGYKLLVNIPSGHKTGFYLDQRQSRAEVKRIAKGKRVLNCFSYTGGYSVAALLGGALEVVSVEVSSQALEVLEKNLEVNQITQGNLSMKLDVFEYLRKAKEDGQKFDLIILDPPKFVNSKSDLDRAARGYKDINRLAFHLLNPGGILATFSCSGHMDDLLFQKIIFSAALEAGCNGQIVGKFMQAEDHPILLTFPESSYLKGLQIRKI